MTEQLVSLDDLQAENRRLRAINEHLRREMNDFDRAEHVAVLSAKVAHQAEQLRQLNGALARKTWALRLQRRALDALFRAERGLDGAVVRRAYVGIYRSIAGSRQSRAAAHG